jgi:hypothetical protein
MTSPLFFLLIFLVFGDYRKTSKHVTKASRAVLNHDAVTEPPNFDSK